MGRFIKPIKLSRLIDAAEKVSREPSYFFDVVLTHKQAEQLGWKFNDRGE
jgi:hypothetical protein